MSAQPTPDHPPTPQGAAIDRGVMERRSFRRGVTIIDQGWHPSTGTWDPDSPAGRAIGLLANGRSRRAAASAALMSEAGIYRWIDRGRGALEAAGVDPELGYADQRERVPFPVRCYADFVIQAEIAYGATDRQLEAKMWQNVLASSNPRDQQMMLARRNPAEWGDAPVQVDAQVAVTVSPAASLLGDPATRAAAMALAESMALAAAARAIETTATETEPKEHP